MADVPTKVEPKKEEQPQSSLNNAQVAKMIADAVAEALKHAIPATAVAINQANMAANNTAQAKLVAAVQKKLKRCPICLLAESACGGPFALDKEGNAIIEKYEDGSVKYDPGVNHMRYYVGPKDDNLRRHFDAVWVNGVPFKSFNPGQLVWIPKKSDIPTIVSHWEKNEKELSQKRVAEGNGAGAVGPGGVHPGYQGALGWR